MQTMTPASHLVPSLKHETERMAAQLLHTFSFVPDEKMNWAPAPSGKGSLQLIVHCAYGNFGMAKAIRREPPEQKMEFAAMLEWMDGEERKVTSRDEAVAMLNNSVAEVLSALDTVTDESLAGMADSMLGEMPMMFWVSLPARHMLGHAYQIDYIQTCYGDPIPHFAG